MTQPVLFIPHGAGPCFFMDWHPPRAWSATEAYLRGIASGLPAPPRAILVVSAHWLAPVWTLTGAEQPGLIHDYRGFPAHTYQLRYPAPGLPALAADIARRLQAQGLEAHVDARRGLDHGVFVPLLLMFPEATVPVLQLSLRRDLDPAAHLAVGQALTWLREDGVLIVGSGMSFHNMRGYGDPAYGPSAAAFDAWLGETVSLPSGPRLERLRHWSTAPAARDCHPPGEEEHLLPLLVAAGAAGTEPGRRAFSDQVMAVTLSAFEFGASGAGE